MREIGGYFELLPGQGEPYYSPKTAIAVNSGRNALRYILRCLRISHLYMPYFTCPVMWDAVRDEGCSITFYHLNQEMLPQEEIPVQSYLLYTNYFGLCGNRIKKLLRNFPNLIVDNAQAFYSPPQGIGCCYSLRKFFGVSDGGYAVFSGPKIALPEQDRSSARFSHLLKRAEAEANDAYADFQRNDASLDHLPVQQMSVITDRLSRMFDYEAAAQKRIENFKTLDTLFRNMDLVFPMFSLEDNIPMYYPIYCNKVGLREHLVKRKIYIPRCWNDSPKYYGATEKMEKNFTDHIYPLIIDQRYNQEDMQRQVEAIYEYISS